MAKLNASIMSYPSRGNWGNYKYRGNCSGHVIKDLLDTFKPKRFVEVFSGGGTGKDVANELGIENNSYHLDLNTGWNALKDDIPVATDFVFSHPPYWDIVDYSQMRNGQHDDDDLSNNMSYEDFITKLDKVNRKIYESLEVGGRHAFLVGDVRKKGKYYSIIKDMTWYGELEEHLIKEQFNTVSAKKQYAGSFVPISHEHLLIFKKTKLWNFDIKFTKDFVRNIREMENVTWRNLIQSAFEEIKSNVTLEQLYDLLADCKKSKNNKNWKAKIRQVVQDNTVFTRVTVGTYQLA